jgi:hypothetical protein
MNGSLSHLPIGNSADSQLGRGDEELQHTFLARRVNVGVVSNVSKGHDLPLLRTEASDR